MILESNKIKLKKMTSEDTEIYHKWRNDQEVMASTNPYLDSYCLEDTKVFVDSVILGAANAKSYIIVDKETDQAIGVTSLINIDTKNRNAECIIDIGEKSFWGKGIGTEVMTVLLVYAFMEMNLHRVELRVFSFNTGAIRLYQKLGFTEEGRSREALYRNGEWYDIIYMGMLKPEYREKGSLSK